MMYKSFLKDFINRTKKNYEIIYNSKEKSYEVTQLLNSAVALLVVPEETHFEKITKNKKVVNHIDNILISQMQNIATSTYKKEKGKQPTFKQLIIHLRNGFAHGYITPNSDKLEEIETITIKDKKYKYVKNIKVPTGEEFEIKLPIELLKNFLWQFSEAVIKYCK